MKHPLKRRLAARKSIALLTGSHASLGLANCMVDFEGHRTKTAHDLLVETTGKMPTYGDYEKARKP